MPKRKCVQIRLIEDIIPLMHAEGMTNRELADHFGSKLKQVRNWVNGVTKRRGNLQITPKHSMRRMISAPDTCASTTMSASKIKLERRR